MTIANCKECGKEVSDIAATCPHCGTPFPNKTAEEKQLLANSVKYRKSAIWGGASTVAISVVWLNYFNDEASLVPLIFMAIGFVQYFVYQIRYIVAKRKLNAFNPKH